MTQFVFPFRIYVEDTDYGGVVYHANYLRFFERGRSEWAERQGRGIEWQREQGILLLVRDATLHYLKPALLHQLVEVVTEIKEVRRASLIYAQHLRLTDAPDTILCKADITVACVDQNFRPRALPDFPT